MKRTFFLLLIATFLISEFSNAQNQQKTWFLENQYIDFTQTSLVSQSPLLGYSTANPPLIGVNGVYDKNNHLLFYVKDNAIINKTGNTIGFLNNLGPVFGKEVVIVPVPGSACKFYVINSSHDHSNEKTDLYYTTVDMTGNNFQGSVGSTIKVLAPNDFNSNFSFAAGKLNPVTNERFMYAVGWSQTDAVLQFKLTSTGIVAVDYFIGPSTNLFYETDLSPDQTKLAYAKSATGNSVTITVINLNPVTGEQINNLTFTIPNLPSSTNVTGFEFSPNSTKLFVSLRNHGIVTINLSSGLVSGPLLGSPAYGESQLELAYDGNIYAANGTDLGAIIAPDLTPSFLQNVISGINLSKGAQTFGNCYKLPDQVDGEDYDTRFVNLTAQCCVAIGGYHANIYSNTSSLWVAGSNPFNEPSNTIKISDELRIQANTTIQNMNIEFGSTGKLIIESSKVLILDNSTVQAACNYQWFGEVTVQPNGLLEMMNNSKIDLQGNGKIFIDRGISGAGRLVYNSGSTIHLNDNNTLLEIKGDLQLGSNAIFSFTGNGFVKFSSPPTIPTLGPYLSDNIMAGAGSQIILNGTGPTDKVLEITQESMYAGSLSSAPITQFSITNGLVALGNDSRINVGCPVTLNNVVVTSTSGGFNNHRGIHLYGQAGVAITGCTFEYGKYGIFGWLAQGGNLLTINSSIFRFCTIGLYTVSRGATLNSCQFLNNSTVGWNAASNNIPSSAVNSTFIQSISGITFNSSNSSLYLKNSTVSSNSHSGVEFGGPSSLTVRCGAVTNNGTLSKDFGILVHSAGNLNMSSTSIAPAGGNVFAINNKNTINLNAANAINLSQGANNFNPALGGKVLIGTVKNGCSTNIVASKNKWGATSALPVQNQTYSLKTTLPCGSQSILLLASPTATNLPSCIVPPPPSGLNANNANALDFCPDCPKITSARFNQVKYNEAVKQTLALMELENASGNDLTAVDMFHQILIYGTNKNLNSKKQDEVVFLNDISYTKMKEALANAFLTGRTTDYSLTNPAIQQILQVQDTLIAEARANNDDFAFFYTSADKAFVHRLINQREKALELLDNISNCITPDSIQNAYLSETRKVALLEYLVFKGEVLKEDFASLLTGGSSAYSSPQGINVAGDTSSTPNGCVNQTVTFRPSVFASSYSWNFGNGITANTASPSTAYTATGTYTVTLIATSACSTRTFLSTITIIDRPVSNFNISTTWGIAPLTVDFTNASTGEGTLSYSWDFGDGNTETVEHPSHTYQDAGTYFACLIASNPCGSDTQCVNIHVEAIPCSPVPANIVSWWAGDGNADDIADGNDGTLMNGATFGTGKVGQAFSLNGAGAFVNIPTAQNLNPSGSFSIEGWINSDLSAGAQVIAMKWGDAGAQSNQRAYGLMALGANGEIHFPISDDANQWNGSFHTFVSPPGLIQTNTWHHVAAVYDQSTGTRYMYVNGQQVAQRTDPPITLTQSTTDLAIGAYIPNGNPSSASFTFKGMIDELSMFNRVLTQSELNVIYNAGSYGKCKAGYSRMQQTANDKSELKHGILQSEFSIYPNPSNGDMTVQYFLPENQKGEFAIYNLIGVKVADYSLKSGINSFSISETSLAEGIYTYRLTSNNKSIEHGKIVIIK